MEKKWAPKEKNWKKLYPRSLKIHRAVQLGFDYPVKNQRQKLESESINVLFVCSMNKWRSPTAERIYGRKPLVNARSGGTSSKARRRVSHLDLNWADVVFVMEKKHKQRLTSEHPESTRYREIHILDIEDNFCFMDKELIDELERTVDPILGSYV